MTGIVQGVLRSKAREGSLVRPGNDVFAASLLPGTIVLLAANQASGMRSHTQYMPVHAIRVIPTGSITRW